MAWFNSNNKADIEKDAPKKTGLALLGSTLWRELRSILLLNFIMDAFLVFPPITLMAYTSGGSMPLVIALLILSAVSAVCLPAAITAMSRITVTMVRDENFFLWQDFKKAFANNFGKALLGGFVFGLLVFVFVFAGAVYYSMFGLSVLFAVIAAFDACLIIITFTASLYYWPMLSYVDLPFSALFKNSFIMVLGCWKRSLLAWIVELFTVVFLLIMRIDFIILLLGFFVIVVNNLFISFSVYPAIYEKVIRTEYKTESLATGLNKEELTWDEEEELQSASIDSLDFGPDDDKEEK